jgi:hypothetical protein
VAATPVIPVIAKVEFIFKTYYDGCNRIGKLTVNDQVFWSLLVSAASVSSLKFQNHS